MKKDFEETLPRPSVLSGGWRFDATAAIARQRKVDVTRHAPALSLPSCAIQAQCWAERRRRRKTDKAYRSLVTPLLLHSLHRKTLYMHMQIYIHGAAKERQREREERRRRT